MTPPAVGPHRHGAAPDAIGLLRAFQRRWRLAIGLGVLIAGAAAVVTWRFIPPPKHTAEALLLVEPEQPKLIATTREAHPDPEIDRRTQVTLIKSPLVLGKVLNEPRVSQLKAVRKQVEPLVWLEREIKAEFQGKILRISLTGDNPSEVAAIVKAVTGFYLSEVAYKEKARRLERNETLKKHGEKLQKELEEKRRELRRLAIELGSSDKQTLSWQQRLAMTQQNTAEQDLLRVQSDLRHAMAELKLVQAKANRQQAGEEPTASASASSADDAQNDIPADPMLLDHIQREAQIKNDLAYAKSVARQQSDPAVSRMRQELVKLQRQRKDYEARLREQFLASKRADKPDGGRNLAESRLTALEDEIGVLKEMEQDLRGEVSKFSGGTKKLGTQALEMETIQDEIASAVNMAKLIGAETEALRIELKAPDRVQLLQEARAPSAVDSGRKIKASGMAAGGVFGAFVLLVSFLEFRARRIDSQDEVAHSLGIRVVGTVPVVRRTALGPASRAAGTRVLPWQHQLTESVETVRIMLTHAAGSDPYRMLLVTSAVGGEGKTSLSGYLATSLARSGRRTLLVDGDFRRPMIHRLYDHAQGPGLCELLRDEVGPEDAVRPTAIDNLWITPVGHPDDRAFSLLSQPRARAVFDRLRELFDFVIVDSAPVLPVADTLLLSQYVDAVLFSILRDVSQAPKVQDAYGRIAALGVTIVGAVVAGTPMNSLYYRST